MEPLKQEQDQAGDVPGHSSGDDLKQEPVLEAHTRSGRASVFKDYLRVFTYATKLDFALMALAGVACIGAGVVRLLIFYSFR